MMWIRRFLSLAAAAAFVGLVVGCWSASLVVRTVEVTPVGEGPDAGDGAFGGAPDLRVDLRVGGSWVQLSTFEDEELGEGLTWTVDRPVPWRRVTAVRLMEDDPAQDDLVEELALQGSEVLGESVRVAIATETDLGAGLRAFAVSPLGILLILGLVGALLLRLFLRAPLDTAIDVIDVASDVLG